MAGMGQRFISAGYSVCKPLINVSGKSMVSQAINDLPSAKNHVFLLRKDMLDYDVLLKELMDQYPKAIIKILPGITEGQACTALLGIEELATQGKIEQFEPITFGACDNGVLYDQQEFDLLLKDDEVDIIIWGVRGHTNALRNPKMFGWISEMKGKIDHISVKNPLENPSHDPIVIGTFTFKRISDFKKVVDRLIKRDGRINGEFYLDSCVNDALELGLKCAYFEVQEFFSWGTPNDLKTFEYWQSCFHKWGGHPYELKKDRHISQEKLYELESAFQAIAPQLPLRK
jgi:choline kinase